ncbi:unnamed protein product [Litomosoides sigmodontis]|uniref:Sodium/potassium-transporting ATPase subunit beta n=1 Tax=Litomosoides sigmodontis TaxID=42156 RepID=A0A3P6TX96_LITSI|nr:unnamed protein product [Litomosoides sigmodontis]
MTRSSARGAREKEAVLKEREKEEKVGSKKRLWLSSSGDEGERQQQVPASETKVEERTNAKEETVSTAAIGASSAAVDVSAGSLHDSHAEHGHNEPKVTDFIKSIATFIYRHGYVCNRTISAWRIGFEPRKRSMRKEQNIFKWNTNDPRSYAFYTQRLRRILYQYSKMEKMPSKFKMDCERTTVAHVGGKPVKHFCKTDVANADENYGYGACALKKNTKFGYDIGAVCVMLRINKLFGYYPEQPTDDLFANSSLDVETNKTCGQAPNATVCCNDDRMLFECSPLKEGTNVTIVQYPKFGYSYCFYPFNNQKGYMQPFVMIQLFNLTPNKRVGIKCVPTAPDLRGRSLTLWFEITGKIKEHMKS